MFTTLNITVSETIVCKNNGANTIYSQWNLLHLHSEKRSFNNAE